MSEREEMADKLARQAVVSRARDGVASMIGREPGDDHPSMVFAREKPLDPNDYAAAYTVLGWIEAAGLKVVEA